jgi:hypothetical protein
MQDTAIKVAINHLPHIESEKAILLGKTLVIDLLKRLEMVFNALVILRILRLARAINRRNIGHWLFSPIIGCSNT